MQVTQAKHVCVVDEYRVGIRHIQAAFNNGCADKDVVGACHEIQEDGL